MNTASNSAWCDVDHELAQLLWLHRTFRRWWYRLLPRPWRSAMRVAYAIHWRALTEFAHDSRPSEKDYRDAGCERPEQSRSSALLGDAPIRTTWSCPETLRYCQAHELVGHISEHRGSHRRLENEWGDDADWLLIESMCDALLQQAGPHLPRSSRERLKIR